MAAPTPGYLHGPMAARAGTMRAQFEAIERQHRGESGRRREDDFRDFLRAFAPERLAVRTGEIAAADGSVSPQVDVIVYDALDTPLLDKSESSVVVPIEGVYGVIEVSSRLDGPKLREDVEKVRRVKAMPKGAYYRGSEPITRRTNLHGRSYVDFPVLGFCFAYESVELDTLLAALGEIDDNDDAKNVDMVCSLAKGCIANGVPADSEAGPIFTRWEGTPSPETERFTIPIDPDEQPGMALMLFYLMAIGKLVQGRTERISLTPYMEIR